MAFKKGNLNIRYGKKPWNYLGDIISKEFLLKEYIVNRKTIKQIAIIVGYSYCAIRYRLIQFNIPIRSLSEAFKGLKKSIEHKKAISKSNKGKHNNKGELNPNFGKKHPGMNRGIKRSKATKIKQSLAKKGMYEGRNNPHFGKPTRPTWGKYKEINMRSNWEREYAKWLDRNNIKWLYEHRTFDLGNSTYTPDFYLPKEDKYIEIKGYFPKETKEKFKLFRKLYPSTNFEVLQGKELSNLNIQVEKRFI